MATSIVEKLMSVREKRRLKAVLFDADFTLADSGPLWNGGFQYLAKKIAKEIGTDELELMTYIKAENQRLFQEMGAHPSKYWQVALRVAERYGLDPERVREWNKTAVGKIYLKAPKLYPGSKQVVGELSQAGFATAIVSHVPEGLSRIRMKEWGWEEMPAFPTTTLKDKGPEAYLRAVAGLSIRPEEAMVVGDSVKGDMAAALEAGIRHRIWVRPTWNPFLDGDKSVLEGVPEIERIGQLAGAIIKHFG